MAYDNHLELVRLILVRRTPIGEDGDPQRIPRHQEHPNDQGHKAYQDAEGRDGVFHQAGHHADFLTSCQ